MPRGVKTLINFRLRYGRPSRYDKPQHDGQRKSRHDEPDVSEIYKASIQTTESFILDEEVEGITRSLEDFTKTFSDCLQNEKIHELMSHYEPQSYFTNHRRVNFDEDLPVGVARKWMKELYKIELMFNRRESDNFCTRWSGGVWWQTVLWDDVWAKNQLLTFQFLLIPPFQTSKDQLLTLNEDECDEYGTIHSSNRWERGGGSQGVRTTFSDNPKNSLPNFWMTICFWQGDEAKLRIDKKWNHRLVNDTKIRKAVWC